MQGNNDEPSPEPASIEKRSRRGRRFVPWIVTIALLAVVARKIDPSAFKNALVHANLLFFVAVTVGGQCVYMAAEAGLLRLLIKRRHGDPGYWNVLFGRAGLSLLSIINYGIGSGGMAVYLKHTVEQRSSEQRGSSGSGRPDAPDKLSRYVYTQMFAVVMDLYTLVCLVALAALLGDAAVPPVVIRVVGVIIVIMIVAMILARSGHWIGRLGARLGRAGVLEPWLTLPLTFKVGYLGTRLIIASTGMSFAWIAATTFDMGISFVDFLGKLPIVLFAAALPVSVGGMGTSQAAAVWAFGGNTSIDKIFAWTIAMSATQLAFRVTIGAFTSKSVMAVIVKADS